MGKKATKAADNIYCMARYEAAECDDRFASREKASEVMGIDRTKLARIELGNVTPYPDEVVSMANAYNAPEICNAYCAEECPIGKRTVKKVVMDDFDRLSLKMLGSLKNVDEVMGNLIAISEDGIVDANEVESFNEILDSLDKIATSAQALKIWAQKNI